MTTKDMLTTRPARLTGGEIMEATGVDNEAMVMINVNDAMRACGDLMAYNQYRVDDELVWAFWWKTESKGRRLLAARTNQNDFRGRR